MIDPLRHARVPGSLIGASRCGPDHRPGHRARLGAATHRRVAIAQASLHRPAILLLDEPTSSSASAPPLVLIGPSPSERRSPS